MLALIQASALADNFNRVVMDCFTLLHQFIREDSLVCAEAIFATILVFHVIVGAAELVSGKESRLASGPFWVRILFTALLVASFDLLFIGFGRTILWGCLSNIANVYLDMWEIWEESISNIMYFQTASAQSMGMFDLALMAVSTFNEMVISSIGLGVAVIIGCCLMVYMFVQGFIATGSACVVLALGPIALSFAAHESTQDIAISYAKTFLVYVILYMPMLLFAFQIANVILLNVNLLTWGATMNGVGGPIQKIVCTVAAPFAAAGFIWAVPNVVKGALK